jgi:hypothetical protein
MPTGSGVTQAEPRGIENIRASQPPPAETPDPMAGIEAVRVGGRRFPIPQPGSRTSARNADRRKSKAVAQPSLPPARVQRWRSREEQCSRSQRPPLRFGAGESPDSPRHTPDGPAPRPIWPFLQRMSWCLLPRPREFHMSQGVSRYPVDQGPTGPWTLSNPIATFESQSVGGDGPHQPDST